MLDRTEIAHDAHAMVSAAGMLGFGGLSDLCRELEAAAHAGDDLSHLIRRKSRLYHFPPSTFKPLSSGLPSAHNGIARAKARRGRR